MKIEIKLWSDPIELSIVHVPKYSCLARGISVWECVCFFFLFFFGGGTSNGKDPEDIYYLVADKLLWIRNRIVRDVHSQITLTIQSYKYHSLTAKLISLFCTVMIFLSTVTGLLMWCIVLAITRIYLQICCLIHLFCHSKACTKWPFPPVL